MTATGFALWMVKPVGDSKVVFGGYGLVVLAASITAAQRGLWIDKRVLGLGIVSLLAGIVGLLVGLSHGNPGLREEVTFFGTLPFLWLCLAMAIDRRMLQAALNVAPLAGLFIGLQGTSFWLNATDRASLPMIRAVDFGQGIGANSFGYELRFYPVTTLVFLVPFVFLSIVVPGTYTWRLSQRLALPSLGAMLALLFVAGRRGILVAVVLATVIAVVLLLRGKPRGHMTAQHRRQLLRVGLLVGAGSAALAATTGFSLFGFVASLRSSGSQDDAVRFAAASALLESWMAAPLFGHGFGAVLEGVVRNEESPWRFEVQYHLIANATGFVGLGLYGFATINLFARAVAATRRHYDRFAFMVPVLAGTISVLIANATNPYLHTPGRYWMFFLTVVGLNVMLRELAERPRDLDGPLGEGHHGR